MYKKIEAEGILKGVQKDKLSIPLDPSNRHYQEYLEWVAEGNTPEEAE